LFTVDELLGSVFDSALDKAVDVAVDGVVRRALRAWEGWAGTVADTSSPQMGSGGRASSQPTLNSSKQFSWGPERLVVNANDPYGYTPKPSFNCDYNNPNYGDERVLMIAKPAADETAGGWTTILDATPGVEYLIRIYYHNSSDPSQVASGARGWLNIPDYPAHAALITAYLTAENTEPPAVWSSILFQSDSAVRLIYSPGSARLFTNALPHGRPVGDGLAIGTGELLGAEGNGSVPGGYQSAGILTCKVRVHSC
jgi:hypothetical protein